MAPRFFPERWRNGGWPAGKAFAFIGGVFGSIFLALLIWLAADQRVVLERSQRLLDKTVPSTLEQFRLARNVEQLRLEGERVLSGPTPVARQQALFIVSLLASHPALLADARAAALAHEVEAFLARAARADSKVDDSAEWATLSNRLSLLADDVSIDGVNLATDDLRQMAATMASSRVRLAIVLAVVAAFVGAILFLIHRYLIRPLQAMDEALSALRSGQASKPFATALMREIGAVEGAIGELREAMHEKEQAARQLLLLATIDDLTGMFNRRHFMALADEEIKRAQRYDRPICVAMADLDFFKQINDNYGHAVGDLVLQSVAQVIEKTLRQSDWVCRYGGEEFAFLFPETGVEEAHRLADRLCQRVARNPLELANDVCLPITLSLGLADVGSASLAAALRRADTALYEAKRQGRNRVAIAPLATAAADPASSSVEPQPPAAGPDPPARSRP
ncbi:diguanylate cyclase [Candidatus Accumulibacter sp. ACC003]|uniref:GGDEF domain-containing protein n=1 Tax=Candidatus Accumulibacter sp. ACC003 TaxID=2823334 RepID=UPI0025B7E04E|nr:diguanylate cyclase [Candidatus Accumulibacter sp. ACC003]